MKKYKITNKKRFYTAIAVGTAASLALGIGICMAGTPQPAHAAQTLDPYITTPAAVTQDEPLPFSGKDLHDLALVIYREAGGDTCSDECRQMVGEVVLNRVADSRYPDTIEEVLLQPRQYGRLDQLGLVWPARAFQPEEEAAIVRAYKCAQSLLDGTAERLLPEDVIFQSEYVQGDIVAVDGFYFCR